MELHLIPPRHYEPDSEQLLYHYCSPETFLAICTGQKIRFCDIFSMNDYLESHWGYRVWEQAATNLIDVVGRDFLDKVDAVISGASLRALPLASCLSLNGDILSQWRAYSQDGLGFSVGFSGDALKTLPVRALSVCYQEDQQVKEVTACVRALHSLLEDEPENEDQFFELAFSLAVDLSSYKNPAFAEEGEVRLVHVINFTPSGSSMKLVDPGGREGYVPQPVKFFMKNGCPVPHLDIPFMEPNFDNPIKKVVVGPRNDSLSAGISVFLETCGIPNVEVIRSVASYR